MNGYRITATRLEDTFELEATRSVLPDPADRVVLADPFSFTWQFQDQVAPNPLEPEQLELNLIAKSPADLPILETGDLWRVTVELVDVDDDTGVVTSHGVNAVDFVGRLGEPEVTLVPGHAWPIRAALRMTDLTADLASRYPTPGIPTPWPAEGFLWWLPQWFDSFVDYPARREFNLWATVEMGDPLDYETRPDLTRSIPSESARWILDAAGASVAKDGQPFILRDRYSLAPPALPGYLPAGNNGVPHPSDPVGYLYQRLNGLPSDSTLPYTLTGPAAGTIELLFDYDPADAVGLAVIPACAVTIPATARRARDLVPNTFVINGYGVNYSTSSGQLAGERIETSMTFSSDWAAPRSRSIHTLLDAIRYTADEGVAMPPAVVEYFDIQAARIRAWLEDAYTPDVGATTAEWAYDALVLDAMLLEPDEFAALVPMLTSWSPEQHDGVALRPVMVYDVADDVDLSGRGTINGTLTGATLRIEQGRMYYELNLSPGVARLEPTGNQLTAAQLAAGPYSSSPATAFADLTALDMRLVRA